MFVKSAINIPTAIATQMPDKIQNGEALLAGMQPQTAAELLEKNSHAVRWPEKQNGIHLGNVSAFTEHIDGEQKIQFSVAEFF